MVLILQKTLRSSFLYNVLQVHKSMTHACMACSAPLDSLILKIFLGNQGKSCERNLRCSKALSNFRNVWKKNMFFPTISPQSGKNTRKPSESGTQLGRFSFRIYNAGSRHRGTGLSQGRMRYRSSKLGT